MNNALLITAAVAAVLSLLLSTFMLFALRRAGAMTRGAGAEQAQKEVSRLVSANEEFLKRGFVELRKELRDMGTEQRAEIGEIFKKLQEDLIKRVNESSGKQIEYLRHFGAALQGMLGKLQEFKPAVTASIQSSSDALNKQQAENSGALSRQLDVFKTSLNGFAEKLISSFTDFRQSVASSFHDSSEALNRKQDEFRDKNAMNLNRFGEVIQSEARQNRKELNDKLKSFEAEFSATLNNNFSDLNNRQIAATLQAKTSLIDISHTIDCQLKAIKDDNSHQLTEMRKTVDEKLQSTLERRLGESFKQVSDRLEQVHKGLGEMQTLAIGVGDLKKVLSNVKTRGMLGEYQLGNILEQILAPDQYATDVAIKQGSYVEFAVKLPGRSDEKTVWLPIDSKFPLSSYEGLLQAYDAADTVRIDLAQKTLRKAVEGFARDISSKYIDSPNTTEFAIMFLPIEGLFAEILRHPETFELLQRKYHITITGPTTLSALLNSLHMGFRTLAVQRRTSEVWKVLAEVKTEFATYSDQLALVHKQLTTASGSLERLKDTRTKAMEKKLRGLSRLEVIEETLPVTVILE